MRKTIIKIAQCIGVLSVAVILGACYKQEENPKDPPQKNKPIGKYMYVSTAGVLHTSSKCSNLKYPRNEESERGAGKFVESNRLCESDFTDYCFRCVDDNAYEEIQTHLDKSKKEIKWENYRVVYVCTGGTAKAYHADPDCRGLSRCRGDIEEMSVEDAESEGKTPCRICY